MQRAGSLELPRQKGVDLSFMRKPLWFTTIPKTPHPTLIKGTLMRLCPHPQSSDLHLLISPTSLKMNHGLLHPMPTLQNPWETFLFFPFYEAVVSGTAYELTPVNRRKVWTWEPKAQWVAQRSLKMRQSTGLERTQLSSESLWAVDPASPKARTQFRILMSQVCKCHYC